MIDPLTLDQMRVLVAVAEAGSFSAAARRLSRVQSAISQAVQAMETTLGVQLFDRSTKRPTLTDSGAAILEDARAIVRGATALRARAQSIASDVEAELTLAVDTTCSSATGKVGRTTGSVTWSKDSTRGTGNLDVSIVDSQGNPICQSTYAVTFTKR